MQLTRPGGSRGTGSPGRRPARGAVSVWAQFRAHSSTYGAVHRWSPGSCSRGSRTVADAGERRATLLESVLGQPLRSSNLLSSAALTCDDVLGSPSRTAVHPKARVSFPV